MSFIAMSQSYKIIGNALPSLETAKSQYISEMVDKPLELQNMLTISYSEKVRRVV